METSTSLLMKASMEVVFRVAANVEQWPRILPHYRWVRVLERSPQRQIVHMAAFRGWIPIQWTSELVVDEKAWEIRFHHLRAFTRGMRVVWTFGRSVDGTQVTISHHLTSHVPVVGRFIVDRIIQKFFVQYVAPRTLECMKEWVENGNGG